MKVAAFDYQLSPDRIAQQPIERRDQSRLMVLRGARGAGASSSAPQAPTIRLLGGEIEHRRFSQLAEILTPGDLLVVNNARVAPARLDAKRAPGGSVELLMVAPSSPGSVRWHALARPARRLRTGDKLQLADGTLLRGIGL